MLFDIVNRCFTCAARGTTLPAYTKGLASSRREQGYRIWIHHRDGEAVRKEVAARFARQYLLVWSSHCLIASVVNLFPPCAARAIALPVYTCGVESSRGERGATASGFTTEARRTRRLNVFFRFSVFSVPLW
jgi:hypothetical protein